MADLVALLLGVWLVGALLSGFRFWSRATDPSHAPAERRLVAAGHGLSWPVLLLRRVAAGSDTGARPVHASGPSPGPTAAPAPAPRRPECRSPLLRGLAADLAEVLPADQQDRLGAMLSQAADNTGLQDGVRAHLALDWFVRVWLPSWTVLVAGTGEQLAAELRALPHVRDVGTAEHAGRLIGPLAAIPATAARTAASCRWHPAGQAAVQAAERAAARAVSTSGGHAAARAAAAGAPEACRVARTDIALDAVAAIALSHGLDALLPQVESWANGPGEMDAKLISIRNLAPVLAAEELKPVVQPLQQSVGQLYWSLVTLGR